MHEFHSLIQYRFGEIISYIERQFDEILAVDCRIKRKPRFQDTRVHALLYFITPTGHGFVIPNSSYF